MDLKLIMKNRIVLNTRMVIALHSIRRGQETVPYQNVMLLLSEKWGNSTIHANKSEATLLSMK